MTADGNRKVALSVEGNWVNVWRGRPGQSKGQEAVAGRVVENDDASLSPTAGKSTRNSI